MIIYRAHAIPNTPRIDMFCITAISRALKRPFPHSYLKPFGSKMAPIFGRRNRIELINDQT
jgi:hypothetical protein